MAKKDLINSKKGVYLKELTYNIYTISQKYYQKTFFNSHDYMDKLS